MKSFVLIEFCLIVCLNTFGQKIISLKDCDIISKEAKTIPLREIENVSDGVIVTYHFENVRIVPDPIYSSASFVKIDGFCLNKIDSEPAYLSRWDSFLIPENKKYIISVIDSAFVDIKMELAPARPPLLSNNKVDYTTDNVNQIQHYTGYFPLYYVPQTSRSNYRGQEIVRVNVTPIKYDITHHTIRFCTDLKYKLTFIDKNDNYNIQSMQTANKDKSFIKNFVLNNHSQNKLVAKTTNTYEIWDDILIVSVPKYNSAVQKLADWKRTLGFTVHVSSKNAWTNSEEVWDSINSYYNSYNNLKYLIIVGDYEDVPSNCYMNSYVSDLDYGIQEAKTDDTADLFRGRLSVSSSQEAIDVIDKIRLYEMFPPTTFAPKGMHVSCFLSKISPIGYEDGRAVLTSEEIRDALQSDYSKTITRVYSKNGNFQPTHWNDGDYANGEEIPYELQNLPWNGNSANIALQINNGLHYIYYHAHSDAQSWTSPNFTIDNINSLFPRTDNAYPIVFSMGCQNGKFNISECFAEALLRRSNKGSVGIFAHSADSYFGESEAMAEGLFFSIWPNTKLIPVFPSISTPSYNPMPEPVYRLGEILDAGALRLEEFYGYSYYEHRITHLLGDPTMYFNTDNPTGFNNTQIICNSNAITANTGGMLLLSLSIILLQTLCDHLWD